MHIETDSFQIEMEVRSTTFMTTSVVQAQLGGAFRHDISPQRQRYKTGCTISYGQSYLQVHETATCMDLRGRRADGVVDEQQKQPRTQRRSLERSLSDGPTIQVQTAPLPQTQWSDVPLPYRPRNYVERLANRQPAIAATTGYDRPARKRTSGSHLSALPAALAPLEVRKSSQLPRNPASLLYPEMSPYADRSSTEPPTARTTNSAPSSPPSFQQAFAEAEPPAFGVPKSPTYPPANRGRIQSAAAACDAAFANDDDLSLFANATAGLEPDSFLQSPISPEEARRAHARYSPPRRTHSERYTSPITQTPTTQLAFQHLAQMPLAASPRRDQPAPPLSRQVSRPLPTLAPAQPPPLRSAVSNLEMSAAVATMNAISALTPTDEGARDDDELPGYAESQAQAQASQRAEAGRRAQELQRRWAARGR